MIFQGWYLLKETRDKEVICMRRASHTGHLAPLLVEIHLALQFITWNPPPRAGKGAENPLAVNGPQIHNRGSRFYPSTCFTGFSSNAID
jgi:hypothetical protein